MAPYTGFIPSGSSTWRRAAFRQAHVCLSFNPLADEILNLNAWKIAVDNLILRKKIMYFNQHLARYRLLASDLEKPLSAYALQWLLKFLELHFFL